jgi:glycosyltransferase involved in cell wall biosynthesis
MSKTILMVAFDFPPSNAASVQRTLKFFEYLNEFGWTTVLLTAKPLAYPLVDSNFKPTLKNNQFIYRATALDVQKHLSIRGKHLSWMKTPDRWGTWIPFATRLGKKIIDEHKPDIIWSTAPTPSANVIANKLAKYSKKPWVADYRDPASHINTNNGSWLNKIHKKIDDITFARADKLTFATEAAQNLYKTHYDNHEKFHVIENGYDENNFTLAGSLSKTHNNIFNEDKFSLYYAGGLYSDGRDPLPLFEAISLMKKQGILNEGNFELIFQGAGEGTEFSERLKQLEIKSLVSFISPTSFLLALVNMTRADALLIIQDSRFNLQIPGKIFEYLRTGRPLLLKTDKEGATAKLANKYENCFVAYEVAELQKSLIDIIGLQTQQPNMDKISKLSRKIKAKELDNILNSCL